MYTKNKKIILCRFRPDNGYDPYLELDVQVDAFFWLKERNNENILVVATNLQLRRYITSDKAPIALPIIKMPFPTLSLATWGGRILIGGSDQMGVLTCTDFSSCELDHEPSSPNSKKCIDWTFIQILNYNILNMQVSGNRLLLECEAKEKKEDEFKLKLPGGDITSAISATTDSEPTGIAKNLLVTSNRIKRWVPIVIESDKTIDIKDAAIIQDGIPMRFILLDDLPSQGRYFCKDNRIVRSRLEKDSLILSIFEFDHDVILKGEFVWKPEMELIKPRIAGFQLWNDGAWILMASHEEDGPMSLTTKRVIELIIVKFTRIPATVGKIVLQTENTISLESPPKKEEMDTQQSIPDDDSPFRLRLPGQASGLSPIGAKVCEPLITIIDHAEPGWIMQFRGDNIIREDEDQTSPFGREEDPSLPGRESRSPIRARERGQSRSPVFVRERKESRSPLSGREKKEDHANRWRGAKKEPVLKTQIREDDVIIEDEPLSGRDMIPCREDDHDDESPHGRGAKEEDLSNMSIIEDNSIVLSSTQQDITTSVRVQNNEKTYSATVVLSSRSPKEKGSTSDERCGIVEIVENLTPSEHKRLTEEGMTGPLPQRFEIMTVPGENSPGAKSNRTLNQFTVPHENVSDGGTHGTLTGQQFETTPDRSQLEHDNVPDQAYDKNKDTLAFKLYTPVFGSSHALNESIPEDSRFPITNGEISPTVKTTILSDQQTIGLEKYIAPDGRNMSYAAIHSPLNSRYKSESSYNGTIITSSQHYSRLEREGRSQSLGTMGIAFDSPGRRLSPHSLGPIQQLDHSMVSPSITEGFFESECIRNKRQNEISLRLSEQESMIKNRGPHHREKVFDKESSAHSEPSTPSAIKTPQTRHVSGKTEQSDDSAKNTLTSDKYGKNNRWDARLENLEKIREGVSSLQESLDKSVRLSDYTPRTTGTPRASIDQGMLSRGYYVDDQIRRERWQREEKPRDATILNEVRSLRSDMRLMQTSINHLRQDFITLHREVRSYLLESKDNQRGSSNDDDKRSYITTLMRSPRASPRKL